MPEGKIHLLITGRHLEKCHTGRLYGIHPNAVNQAAGVRTGDTAYIFSKIKGRVYGPYAVTGELSYLPLDGKPPIWEREPETSRERFRLIFPIEPAGEPSSAPINAFYEIARSLGVAFRPEDVMNRSIFTFLPDDARRLRTIIAELPWQKALFPARFPQPTDDAKRLDGRGLRAMAARERRGESFLEYILARGAPLEKVLGKGTIAWNQLRLSGERSRIDLIYKSGSTLYVIELKSGPAGVPARREVVRYAVWAKANRRFLARQFSDATPMYIQPVLIGAGCPGPKETECLLITYAFSGDVNVELERLN